MDVNYARQAIEAILGFYTEIDILIYFSYLGRTMLGCLSMKLHYCFIMDNCFHLFNDGVTGSSLLAFSNPHFYIADVLGPACCFPVTPPISHPYTLDTQPVPHSLFITHMSPDAYGGHLHSTNLYAVLNH